MSIRFFLKLSILGQRWRQSHSTNKYTTRETKYANTSFHVTIELLSKLQYSSQGWLHVGCNVFVDFPGITCFNFWDGNNKPLHFLSWVISKLVSHFNSSSHNLPNLLLQFTCEWANIPQSRWQHCTIYFLHLDQNPFSIWPSWNTCPFPVHWLHTGFSLLYIMIIWYCKVFTKIIVFFLFWLYILIKWIYPF